MKEKLRRIKLSHDDRNRKRWDETRNSLPGLHFAFEIPVTVPWCVGIIASRNSNDIGKRLDVMSGNPELRESQELVVVGFRHAPPHFHSCFRLVFPELTILRAHSRKAGARIFVGQSRQPPV